MHALIANLEHAMMLNINKDEINRFSNIATETIVEGDGHTSSALKWIAYFSRPNECKKLSTVG